MKTFTRRGSVETTAAGAKKQAKRPRRISAYLFGAGSVFDMFGNSSSATSEKAIAGDALIVQRSFGRQFSKAVVAAKRRPSR